MCVTMYKGVPGEFVGSSIDVDGVAANFKFTHT